MKVFHRIYYKRTLNIQRPASNVERGCQPLAPGLVLQSTKDIALIARSMFIVSGLQLQRIQGFEGSRVQVNELF